MYPVKKAHKRGEGKDCGKGTACYNEYLKSDTIIRNEFQANWIPNGIVFMFKFTSLTEEV